MVQSEQANNGAAPSEAEEHSPLAELGVAPRRVGVVRRLLRTAAVVALVAYFGFAAVVLALRFWVLPYVEQHPERIAQAISRGVGQRVSIGGVDSGWRRLRPYLALSDVRLYDAQGRVALSLPQVSLTVSWDSLVFARLRLHTLTLERPHLNIRRDESGAIYIAGVKLNAAAAGAGFSNWLLGQREVVVHDAQLRWDDQLRNAPTLSLDKVNFVMRNRGSHHRFALRALPARELAAALEVRGDMVGKNFDQLQAWNGRLYASLGYTDLAAWRAWIDYPFEIRRGRGGLRLWLGFADKHLQEATADVALADLSARLAPDLPPLELRFLRGRLSARMERGGYEIGGKQVALALQSGATLPPAQFSVRWRPADAANVAEGEVRIDALQLQPLALLGEYLPLPAQLRGFLSKAAPQGSVSDMQFDWRGALSDPQHYSARGHFDRVGMRSYGSVPGFSGISGYLDGTERGGSAVVNASKVQLVLPQAYAQPARSLDTLAAQIAWTRERGRLQLKLTNIAVANADLAATASCDYASAAQGPGSIDLNVRISRADAHRVVAYIPFMNKAAADWMESAIRSGQASDGSLHLKGDLKDFPFRGKKDGVFQIAAHVTGASLRYAPDWPSIEGIDADVRIDGGRMEITSRKATVLGSRVAEARVVVPDLFKHEHMLEVDGQAEGPTAEFLKFMVQSPLHEITGKVTANMRAKGNGSVQLKLAVPLAHPTDAKVAGSYQFTDNQIRIDPDLPPLTQVNGRLNFSETGVNMRAANAQFLGGPTTISIASLRDGGINVDARGTASAAGLQAAFDEPLLRQLSGSSAWTSKMKFRKRGADILVESNLQGIASALPAPLAKARATELPLRVERTTVSTELGGGWIAPPTADRTVLNLGSRVRMELQRSRKDGKMVIERGAIGINEAPRLPEKDLVLNGNLAELDLDRWLSVLGGSDGMPLPLTSLSLKVGALDVYGKRINDVSLRAGFRGKDWLANVDARELSGLVRWRSQGKGRVSAQFSHFTFPEPTPGKVADESLPKELPGLDIVADNLVVHDKKLGRLQLNADNDGLDWRIKNLTLTTPEAKLTADGVWQGRAAQQRTTMNLKLEVSDVGKYLDRLGYPGSMQRGHAKLLGKLSWAGGPQSIDYPTLSGDLSLIAGKGQFLKIEPGLGKLLGILSLQALPRRITLDFRDIFSEGFAFDTITATASVANGVLHTQDFAMSGPSALVGMSGTIDLANETQSLRVRVVPSVGDSLSVAGGLMLANPIAGVASFLAQRLLKDPLGRALAYEYAVTGTWSDPIVKKLPHEAAAGDGKGAEEDGAAGEKKDAN